jgi:uncharacterized membrane protein YdjX (TVP38/TMEM64 family)
MSATDPTASEGRPGHPWARWMLATLVIAGVAGFYALGLQQVLSWSYLRGHLDGLRAVVRRDPLPALVLFFLAYVAAAALSLPASAALTAAAGALFGRWLGTAVADLAATAGASLAFLGSRYLLRDWVRRRFGERLEAIDRGVGRGGPYYLFTLRLVPVFPFFLINLGMGLTSLGLVPFALVSLVGMLPGTFLYANAGRELGRVASPGEALSSPRVLVALALLGVAPLVLRRLVGGKQRPRLHPATTRPRGGAAGPGP